MENVWISREWKEVNNDNFFEGNVIIGFKWKNDWL